MNIAKRLRIREENWRILDWWCYARFFRCVDIKSIRTMRLCRCSSMVGQTGRRQAITLASGCWTNGIVAHEIGKFYRLRESFPVPYGRGTGHNHPFESSLPSVYFRRKSGSSLLRLISPFVNKLFGMDNAILAFPSLGLDWSKLGIIR